MAKDITLKFNFGKMPTYTKCLKCTSKIHFNVPISGYVNNFTCPSCNQEYAAFRKIGGAPMLVYVEKESGNVETPIETTVEFITDLMDYSKDDRIIQLEQMLKKAEQQEKYENAAKIRDEIRKLKNPGN